VLGMLAAYAALLALDVAIVPLMCGFGLAIALAIGALMRWDRRGQEKQAAAPA